MAWEPLLSLGPDTWVGVVDEDRLYVGSFERPIRRVDVRNPTGLLPLLERPYTVVRADLDEVGGDLIPVDAVPAAAVAARDSGWVRLALSWLADMPPSEPNRRLLVDIEEAPWAEQDVRHGARRVRRALYGLGG